MNTAMVKNGGGSAASDEVPWFVWNVREMIECLTIAIKSGFERTIYISGQRGTGKSAGVRQAAEARSAVLVDRRLSMMDPSDVRGVLMARLHQDQKKVDEVAEDSSVMVTIDSTGLAQWLANPDFFPVLKKGQRLVLFLDEFNHAPSLVQKASYEIAWDHSIAGRKLHEGTVVILAGNLEGENANVTAIDKPMRRRVIWSYLKFDFDVFWDYALKSGKFHPLVLGWLNPKGGRPDAANKPIDDVDTEYFGEPLPASWEMVSDIERTFGATAPHLAEKLVAGAVGPGMAAEYNAWRATAGQLQPLIEKIVAGSNDTAPEMSQQFFVAMSLAERFRSDATLAKRVTEYALATKDSVPEMSGLMFSQCYKYNGTALRNVSKFRETMTHYSRYII